MARSLLGLGGGDGNGTRLGPAVLRLALGPLPAAATTAGEWAARAARTAGEHRRGLVRRRHELRGPRSRCGPGAGAAAALATRATVEL